MTQRQTLNQAGYAHQRTAVPQLQHPNVSQKANSLDLLIQTAVTRPETLSASDGARLQRAIGNHAVGRILASAPTFSTPTSSTPTRTTIQAKMQVGPAGDRYEQEADRVADSVMRSLSSTNLHTAGQPNDDAVQRKAIVQRRSKNDDMEAMVGADGGHVTRSFEHSLQRARGSGQPMETGLRSRMEAGMGAAFSGVRLHTDTQADSLSRSVSARAFTSGPDIFFRSGEYNPGSSSGQRLLAHELTHVVQQGAATQRSPKPPNAQRAPDEIQRKKKKGAGDIGGLETGLTPNFAPVDNDAPAGYQVTVGVARILPEFLIFAKERMKSTIRNKVRAKARSVPLLKGLVRKAKDSDEIKTKAAKRAVRISKTAQGVQNVTPTQQEIQDVIANSNSTGHSWIKFSTLNDGGQPTKTYSFGFYAGAAPARPTDVVAGEVHNPDTYFENSAETRFLSTRVSAAKYAQGLDKAAQLKANPPAYTTIDYNCTKFAREVAKAAGATFPSGAHMMIPFSTAGQIRMFHKAFNPNALFEKVEQTNQGEQESPEKKMLSSGDFTVDPVTGQLNQAPKDLKEKRTANIIRHNAEQIGNWDQQAWLQAGLTSDKLEDLETTVLVKLVEDEVDVAGLFATFGLDIPQVALIAAGKVGKTTKSFSADSLYGNRRGNIQAGKAVRISKIEDGEVQFEVAQAGQYKMELDEFVKYVDFS